jgi:Tropinone reductase 1
MGKVCAARRAQTSDASTVWKAQMSNPSRWRLDGQTVLVTGASTGIGLACARELAALGADVLMVARNEAHMEHARAELAEEFPEREVLACAADVSVHEQRMEVFDWIADLDMPLSLLVNNAGSNVTRAALDYSESEYRALIDTNLVAAFELSRLAHAHLREHANAAIVNVGSVSGLTHVRSGAVYGFTKAALHQLTRNLACEWAADGIRVNSVAPWYIRTRRTEAKLSNPDYHEEVIARTPMARIGEPEEAAGAVAFLCLPAASYVTGECIAVDGGFLRYGF